MPQERTRAIVITGAMASISVLLGWTHWGFIPWFGGISLTIMHVPVIIAAILAGPVSGMVVGLIFGVFSMIQAAIAPSSPADVWFTNPLLAVLPRLFIGPAAWLAYTALKRWEIVGLSAAGLVGSATNTILVLFMIGLLNYLPWAALGTIAVVNGVPEAIVSTIIVVIVVSAWKRIELGRRRVTI
jgi:uncharacterized membrane protein